MEAEESKMLREVHESVVGNPNTGNRGLLARVKILETKTQKLIVYGASLFGAVEAFKFLHK